MYDKDEIKNNLTKEQIFDLLTEWGGEPEMTSFGIISATICHNNIGKGSRKLYYYDNSHLFHCYTNCENSSFDIFELVVKVAEIQNNIEWKLNNALSFIAHRFNFAEKEEENSSLPQLKDWKYLTNYNRIEKLSPKDFDIILKEYDKDILERFNYTVKNAIWLKEDITQEVIDFAKIGFYPGGDQITIPHYDINGRFIGLRGRALGIEEAEKFGKYRPIKANNILYNHPLSMNLYGINWAKNNIKNIKKALIFESETIALVHFSH